MHLFHHVVLEEERVQNCTLHLGVCVCVCVNIFSYSGSTSVTFSTFPLLLHQPKKQQLQESQSGWIAAWLRFQQNIGQSRPGSVT